MIKICTSSRTTYSCKLTKLNSTPTVTIYMNPIEGQSLLAFIKDNTDWKSHFSLNPLVKGGFIEKELAKEFSETVQLHLTIANTYDKAELERARAEARTKSVPANDLTPFQMKQYMRIFVENRLTALFEQMKKQSTLQSVPNKS